MPLPPPPLLLLRLFDSIRSKSAVLLRSTAAPMLEKLALGFGSVLTLLGAAADCGAAAAAVISECAGVTAAVVAAAFAKCAADEDGFREDRNDFRVRPENAELNNELPLLLFSTGGAAAVPADRAADPEAEVVAVAAVPTVPNEMDAATVNGESTAGNAENELPPAIR